MNWRRQNPAVDDADSALAPTLLPGQGAVAAPSIPQPPPAGDETQATMLRWFESAPTRGDQVVDLRDRTYLPPQPPPPPPPQGMSAWMPETMPPPPPGEAGSGAESWYAGPAAPAPAAGWFTDEAIAAGGPMATPSPALPIVNPAEATALDPFAVTPLAGPGAAALPETIIRDRVTDPVAAATAAPSTMAIPLPAGLVDGAPGAIGGPGKIVVFDLHRDQPAPTHAPVRVLGDPQSPAAGVDAGGDLAVDGWSGATTATKQSPARRMVTMLLVLLGVVAGGAVVRSAMNSSEPVKVFGVTLSEGNGQTAPPTSGPTKAPAAVPSVTQTSVVTKNGTRSTFVQVVPGKTTKSTSAAGSTSAPASPTTKASVSPTKAPTSPASTSVTSTTSSPSTTVTTTSPTTTSTTATTSTTTATSSTTTATTATSTATTSTTPPTTTATTLPVPVPPAVA